jgi:hypothetical protein
MKTACHANGRWVAATHYGEEVGRQLVRLNLLTNKHFPVIIEEYPLVEAVALFRRLIEFYCSAALTANTNRMKKLT